MRAARYYGNRDIRLDDVPEPQVAPGLVKIKVKWSSIEISDLNEYVHGPRLIPTEPHPLTGAKIPLTMGSMYSGQIEEIGEGVTNVAVGDRVAVDPILFCRECPACLSGSYAFCIKGGTQGRCGIGGSFAEYVAVPSYSLHKLPDSVSYEEAAFAQPIAVALHAIRRSGFIPGQSALVSGAGIIGLISIAALKAYGAKRVYVMQRKSIKQEWALAAGADVVFDPSEPLDESADGANANLSRFQKWVADRSKPPCAGLVRLQSETAGGVHVAIEATGVEDYFNTALAALRFDGSMSIVSAWLQSFDFNPMGLLFGQKTITGSLGHARQDFLDGLSLLEQKKLPIKQIITQKIHLEDIVTDGFDKLAGPERQNILRILVTPDRDLL